MSQSTGSPVGKQSLPSCTVKCQARSLERKEGKITLIRMINNNNNNININININDGDAAEWHLLSKPSAEKVKRPAVSKREPLPVSSGGESPPTSGHRPAGNPAWGPLPARAKPSAVGVPALLSPGQGAGAPPGHPTCGKRQAGSPGPGPTSPEQGAPSPASPAGSRSRAGARGGGALPWSTDPMMRSGWRGPGGSAASLCIWRARAGAGRVRVRVGVGVGVGGRRGAPSSAARPRRGAGGA